MPRKFSNHLTPAQTERLVLVMEEAGEVVQAAAKVLRHGYASRHPNSGQNNRDNLTAELGDMQVAVSMMLAAGDIKGKDIVEHAEDKLERVRPYIHHQPKALIDRAAAGVGRIVS